MGRTRGRSRQLRRRDSPPGLRADRGAARRDRPCNDRPGEGGRRARVAAGRGSRRRLPRSRLPGYIGIALGARAEGARSARSLPAAIGAGSARRSACLRGGWARTATPVRGRSRSRGQRVTDDERRAVVYGLIVTGAFVGIDLALGSKAAISSSCALGAIVSGVL